MKLTTFIPRLIRLHPGRGCNCSIAWCWLDELLACRLRSVCDKHDNWILRSGPNAR